MSPPQLPDPAAPIPTASGRYQLLDHTADLRLRLYAPTPQALYSTAVEALYAVLTDGASPSTQAPRESVKVSFHGTDPADLLVQLLNEALYHVERTGKLPALLEAVQTSGTELNAILQVVGLAAVQTSNTNQEAFRKTFKTTQDAFLQTSGIRLEQLLELKAATYSELRWEADADGLIAEVTLDL